MNSSIEETFRKIVREELNRYFSYKQEKNVMKIKDLAERYGYASSSMYSKPWLLPNYGKSDFETGVMRWRLTTISEWEAIPVKERMKKYFAKCREETIRTAEQNKKIEEITK